MSLFSIPSFLTNLRQINLMEISSQHQTENSSLLEVLPWQCKGKRFDVVRCVILIFSFLFFSFLFFSFRFFLSPVSVQSNVLAHHLGLQFCSGFSDGIIPLLSSLSFSLSSLTRARNFADDEQHSVWFTTAASVVNQLPSKEMEFA